MRARIALFSITIALFLSFFNDTLGAENVYVKAEPINYKSRFFFSPRTYTVTTGSEFDASLYVDTSGFSINTIDLQISFPANLISVVRPSNGESVIGLWVTPPTYSNSRGTMEFSGVILGGIKTNSALIEKMTFRAKTPGTGSITIRKTSRVLINDGLGTDTEIETIPLNITVESKAPDGVQVISNTHPFQGVWSNNKDPVFSWEKNGNEVGYSYLFDDKPFTSPDDIIDSADTQVGYENIKDGIWYFHIKSKTGNIWSIPTHYAIRVDTIPPAQFTPTIDLIADSSKSPAIISFFSTDALSGIARYEVGALDAGAAEDTLPGFIESESPYYLSKQTSGNTLVTVRAVDQAGNVRDETINVHISPPFLSLIQRNTDKIVLGISLLVLFLGIIMITFSWRRRKRLRQVWPDEMRELIEFARQGYLPSPQDTASTIIPNASVAYMAPKSLENKNLDMEKIPKAMNGAAKTSME